MLLAEAAYSVSANVILDSAMRSISSWDILSSILKCWVFGTIISSVSSLQSGLEYGNWACGGRLAARLTCGTGVVRD